LDGQKYEKENKVQLHRLPDGSFVEIGAEAFKCVELLFYPAWIDREGQGIPSLIVECIKKCDIDLRKDLFQNILLTGGTSLMPGFKDRLHKDICKIVPDSMVSKVKVIESEQKQNTPWLGGSVFASLLQAQDM
jgi:actin-related protein